MPSSFILSGATVCLARTRESTTTHFSNSFFNIIMIVTLKATNIKWIISHQNYAHFYFIWQNNFKCQKFKITIIWRCQSQELIHCPRYDHFCGLHHEFYFPLDLSTRSGSLVWWIGLAVQLHCHLVWEQGIIYWSINTLWNWHVSVFAPIKLCVVQLMILMKYQNEH